MVANAIRETALLRLSRVYDQEPNALSLRKLLLTIEANKHLFEETPCGRGWNTAYANSITPGSHLPSDETLQADLALVSFTDPQVNKLVIWRGNFVAHISAKLTTNNTLGDEKLLTQEEAFALGDRALNNFQSLPDLISSSQSFEQISERRRKFGSRLRIYASWSSRLPGRLGSCNRGIIESAKDW